MLHYRISDETHMYIQKNELLHRIATAILSELDEFLLVEDKVYIAS